MEPLGWSIGSVCRTTCNLHRKDDPAGVCRPPLRWLSQFLSYEKEIIQLFYGIITAYLLWWSGSIFIRGNSGYFPC